jgi:hypothetical protein
MVFDRHRDQGRDPEIQHKGFSPSEKRPGHHAHEALLLFFVRSSVASVDRLSPLPGGSRRLALRRSPTSPRGPRSAPCSALHRRWSFAADDLVFRPTIAVQCGFKRMCLESCALFPSWRRHATGRRDSYARFEARSSGRISPARLLLHISERTSMELA